MKLTEIPGFMLGFTIGGVLFFFVGHLFTLFAALTPIGF